MIDTQDSFPNPLNLGALIKHAKVKAGEQGFTEGSKEADAFRHVYTNAMVVWKYGIVGGGLYTEVIGNVYEGLEMGAYMGIDMLQSTAELLGIKVDLGPRVDSGDHIRDGMMDIVNNQIGLMIGSTATSEEDIIQKVTAAIRAGQVIIDPSKIPDMLEKADTGSNSFVSNEWGAMGSTEPASRTNIPDLVGILGGRKNRSGGLSVEQALMTSAAGLARELLKSRRNAMEEDLIDIFTGGKGKQKLPGSPASASGASSLGLPNILGGLFENMIGAAFSRQRTRVSSSESERSVAARGAWNTSQGQQAAQIAQMVAQGQRNL